MSGKRRTHNLFVKKGGCVSSRRRGPNREELFGYVTVKHSQWGLAAGLLEDGFRLSEIKRLHQARLSTFFPCYNWNPEPPLTSHPSYIPSSLGRERQVHQNKSIKGVLDVDSGHIDLYSHNNNHMDEKKPNTLIIHNDTLTKNK